MPPLPRIRSPHVERLAERLKNDPPARLLPVLRAAELVADEIDPAIDYPVEWLLFRLTGRRGSIPGSIPGADLLSDLGSLVERLSWNARLDASSMIDADALALRWRVSRKTIDRYRKRGLVACRVLGPDARARLAFSTGVVERFEVRRRHEIDRAAGFSRLDDRVVARALRLAARYARVGLSRADAARRIALRLERSHETIRQLLLRHDAHAEAPLFQDRGPVTPRERRFIRRASARWIDPATIARRLSRPERSVSRLAADSLASSLVSLRLQPRTSAPDPACLDHPAVTAGLGLPAPTDAAAFLVVARAAPVPVGVEERARARAFHALLARAASALADLPSHGVSPSALDRIATDLRWASRLKAELVRSQFGLLVRTLESRLPIPLDHLRGSELWPLAQSAVLAIADAVSAFDPARGGRLAAPAGLAVDRVALAWVRSREGVRAGAASPRLTAAHSIEDWTRALDPWQPLLEPPPYIRPHLHLIDEPLARFLRDRFAWANAAEGAAPPRTLDDMGRRLGVGMGRVRAALLERRSMDAARSAAFPHRARPA